MKTAKCVVVCYNANGCADVFPCKVIVKDSIDAGNHYEVIRDEAYELGYENPMVVATEDDPLFKYFLNSVDWNDVHEIDTI